MQGRFYLLGHPCFSISLSQQPGTADYTWSSFLDSAVIVEDNFWWTGVWGRLRDDSSAVHLLWALLLFLWSSLLAQSGERLPAVRETWVQSLGWEDLLEKEMTTHSGILARRIPWTEEPGGLQFTGSQRIRHSWVTNTYFYCYSTSSSSGHQALDPRGRGPLL